MRPDLDIIAPWIRPKARVLDLGCGDGELLGFLAQQHAVTGYGLEIDPEKIRSCIARGVNVIEQNIDEGLRNFDDGSFDTVLMTQALQALHNPHLVIAEMLRVGREAIVTFPNFGHWRPRFYLALRGRMPMSESLPHHWYDTPNIHFCTFRDFEMLCHDNGWRVLDRLVTDGRHREGALMQAIPNLLGEIAIYRLTRH
ncbi:MAG: methionine biosynthesis protein MetW [Gammaproteobacteria bacterium]